MSSKLSIPEWYKDRGILITGGTGFLGKVMIAKLLTSCPHGGNIYILIREKRGIRPEARLKSIIEEEIFRTIREKYPERMKRLNLVTGDVVVEGLGISPTDNDRLVKDVSVIFHAAANIKFDLSLKTAINTNTKGVMNIVSFAKKLPNLVSLIHVSTAYCQIDHMVLEEKAYLPPISPENLLSIVDTLNDEILNSIEPKLLGSFPNTYGLSKCLSEDIMVRSKLPVGIGRPSIVTASYLEPAPGFVDNIRGPTGLIVAAGKGVIHSMLCNRHYSTKIVPCDITVNSLIALARKVGDEQPVSPIFINITESRKNPLTWGDAIEIGRKHVENNPFTGPLWYPTGTVTSSALIHWLCVIFLHIIPAYFLDTLLIIFGRKPFMVKVYNKVAYGLKLLQYYTIRDWIFRIDEFESLQNQLSPEDKEIFFMDTSNLDWNDYLLSYVLGIRKFILKDDPSTLPRSRRILWILYLADRTIKVLLASFFLWYLYSWIFRSQPMTNFMVIVDQS